MAGNHAGFPFCRFRIVGLGLTDLAPEGTPFICGVPSSSVFTALGLRLLLFVFGLVFALGPLEAVPCWLCCRAMEGA